MKTPMARKLVLGRETLRSITSAQLDSIAGGPTTAGCAGASNLCGTQICGVTANCQTIGCMQSLMCGNLSVSGC